MKKVIKQWLITYSLGVFLILFTGLASAQTNGKTGNVKLLIIPSEWTDGPLTRSEAEMEQIFRDNFDLAETYWKFHSYGKITGFTLTFTTRYTLSGTLPTAANPAVAENVQQELKNLAVSDGFVLNNYDHIVTSMPSFSATRPFAGLGAPGFGILLPGQNPSWVGFIHELGHAFGVGHAGHFEGGSSIFTGFGSHVEGRDGLYMMGSEGGARAAAGVPIRHGAGDAFSRTGINVLHSHRMNHLTDANVIYPGSNTVVRLFDIGTGTLSPGKNVAAVVDVLSGSASGEWWLSYSPKMAEHWSSDNGSGWLDGINFHVRIDQSGLIRTGSLDFTPGSQGGTGNEKDYVDSRDGALRVGSSWTFPGTTITVTPLSTGTQDGVKYIDVDLAIPPPNVTGTTDSGPFVDQNEYRYDFGPEGSPLSSGYTRLTENTFEGYVHWQSISGIDSRDRGAAQNDLNRDFIFSSRSRTLVHQVTNGSYEVTLNMFDASGVHDNMQVRAEGVVKLSNQTWGGNSGNQTLTFNVDVSDGNLNLDFSDQGGSDVNWVLNRLVVKKNGGPSGTLAFGGTNRAIPGTIEAEDFDTGGNGVSYNDTSTGNNGSSNYRQGTDVDITPISGGNGLLVGWIANGEFWEYTVNVAAGDYDIDLSTASNVANPGDAQITLDGVNLGTFSIGNTNDWNNFQTVSLNGVSLSGGNDKKLRITAVNGGAFNVDKITFTSAGGGGSNPPTLSFVGPTPQDGADLNAGSNISVEVTASAAVDNITLFRNGALIRQDGSAPYEWGSQDSLLQNLAAGTYTFRAEAVVTGGGTAESSFTITVSSGGGNNGGGNNGGNNTAFGGTLRTIPGLIEAEDFDTGANGTAYSDTTAGNTGPDNYRSGTDVDLENRTGNAGGHNIGWVANNEWTQYSVNATAGTYDIEIRVASGSGNPGDMKVELDGIDLGTFPVVNTGGWASWSVLKLSNVTVAAASNKQLRLTATNGGSFNWDWVKFTAAGGGSSGGGTPQTVNATPSDDAFLQNGNLQGGNLLRIQPGSTTRETYLKFNVTGVNGTVTGSKLILKVTGDDGSGTISVYRGTSDSWTESNLSGSNAPARGALLGTKNGIFGLGSTVEIDLGTGISGNGVVSLIVVLNNGGNDVAFSSKEGANAPVLEVSSQ